MDADSDSVIRQQALLLAASDYVFEHRDAEAALAWMRRMEEILDTDPLWANGGHSGDCTKTAHTCTRCFIEGYEDAARRANATDMSLDCLDFSEAVFRPRPQPDPKCPSCGGTGWATIRISKPNITVAGGWCRCVGGHTWSEPLTDKSQRERLSRP